MPDPDGVARHIQHAEEWLRWARSDYRRGDMRAAVLRLLLAEAEIRHARETGTRFAVSPRASWRPRRRGMAVVGVAVALVLAAAAYTTLRSGGRYGPVAVVPSFPGPGTAAPLPPGGVVQLETGRFLTLVPALAGADQEPGGGARLREFQIMLRPGGDEAGPSARQTDLSDYWPVSLTTPGEPGSLSAAF
jgi:hypothetical protein